MTCTWYPTPLGGCYVATSRARGMQAVAPTRLRRFARRLLVAVAGSVAIVAGLVMLVLPGPGLVTIVLGFGVLGREFAWAARVTARVRDRLTRARDALLTER
jgi:uncharacterized protein (TIGR02611 family)